MTTLHSPVLASPLVLPTELIVEILRIGTLHESDLARCCLVNSLFLALAQPLLYHTIHLNLYIKDFETGEDGWVVKLFRDSSAPLFRTLRENPSIGRIPRRLELCAQIETEIEPEDDLVFNYREEAIQFFLESMPGVNSLKINDMMWESGEAATVILSNCERWTEFELEEWLYAEEDETVGDLSNWINLKKLRCYGLTFEKPPQSVLPDNLEILDLYAWNNEAFLKPANFSSNSQLRILRISSSEAILSTILTLPRLEQLHFHAISRHPQALSSSTLSSFAKLPRLRLLSFRFNSVTNSNTLPLELLAHLPPTLTRLEFLEYIPFQPLLAFLHDPRPSSVRTLGINESTTSSRKIKMEMTAIFSACREKHVRIEYISTNQDLFLA